MSSDSRVRKSWLGRNKWYFIVGIPLFSFILGPFPLGLGMYFPIRDNLRGHPQGRHGTQPSDFVGLWVRDESIEFDSVGQAFYLMSDGRFAHRIGMTERRWHFDNNRLFVDAVSHCGNCYQGNVTSEFTAKFIGPDELLVARLDQAERGVGGTYRRILITDAMKSKMNHLQESNDDAESFRARSVLGAIDFFERMSKTNTTQIHRL